VRIEDRGPGVALADRERIFSPFFTTKDDGSGLGLALAHRTIEEHQRSPVGRGARGRRARRCVRRRAASDSRLMTRRILIVDDDRSIRETLLGHFTRSGIDASAVESAEAALSRLAVLDPDLMLTDVRMPGMDGLALLALVRERAPTSTSS
jgi:PleD family two-component response regulator